MYMDGKNGATLKEVVENTITILFKMFDLMIFNDWNDWISQATSQADL